MIIGGLIIVWACRKAASELKELPPRIATPGIATPGPCIACQHTLTMGYCHPLNWVRPENTDGFGLARSMEEVCRTAGFQMRGESTWL